MTSRNPPPPAPVTLTPVAPAARASSTIWSIRSFETPDASCRFVSQPCRIAPPTASTSPLRKTLARGGRQVSQGVQLRKCGGDVRRLLTEDRVGAPGDAGVEEHDLPLERPAVDRGELDLVGDHVGPGAEAEVADTAERGDVLVLLADALAAKVDFDRARPLSELFAGEWPTLVRREGVEQADRDGRRGTEPGTGRWDIGQHGDLDPVLHPCHEHGFAHEVVLQILDARDDLLLRVVDIDVVVEALLDDDVDVLVDGTVQDPTAVLEVVVGEIGATTDEADAQRSLGDDHEGTLGRHSRTACCVGRWSADVAEVTLHGQSACPSDQPGEKVVPDVAGRRVVDIQEHASD